VTSVPASDCQWRDEGGGTAIARRCLSFLKEVGIEVGLSGGHETQLLDGLAIAEGKLLIDPVVSVWPSDLLHEAGHIAVASPEDRANLDPIEPDATDEMMAIAWSYAASRACNVSLEQLFHDGGYRDDNAWLQQSFASGTYIGAPKLSYHGMTEPADAGSPDSFPAMCRWIR